MMRIMQLALAVLLTFCASCSQDSPQPVAPSNNPKPDDAIGSGNLGGHSQSSPDGRWSTTLPYIRDGHNQMILCLLEDPENPWRPAFVLFLKLDSAINTDITFKDTSEGEMAVLEYTYPTSTDERFQIRYLYADEKLPVVERLSLGGKDYAFDSGRIFLIELSANPVNVTQLDNPIPFSIPDDSDTTIIKDHTQANHLQILRDSLAKENDRIKQFLDAQ